MADNHDDTMGQYRIQLVPSYGQFMTWQGISAGVMHNTRGGGDCDLKPIIHRYGCLDDVLRSTCVLSVKRHLI